MPHLLPKCSDPNFQKIIEQHKTVFMGEGKLNTQQVKIQIKPVVQPQCRIPYHMQKEVSKELQKLIDEDIIEKETNHM